MTVMTDRCHFAPLTMTHVCRQVTEYDGCPSWVQACLIQIESEYKRIYLQNATQKGVKQ